MKDLETPQMSWLSYSFTVLFFSLFLFETYRWYETIKGVNPETFLPKSMCCFSWMNTWGFLYTSLVGTSWVLYMTVWKYQFLFNRVSIFHKQRLNFFRSTFTKARSLLMGHCPSFKLKNGVKIKDLYLANLCYIFFPCSFHTALKS